MDGEIDRHKRTEHTLTFQTAASPPLPQHHRHFHTRRCHVITVDMGAAEPVVEREGEEVEVREENGKNKEEGEESDVEKGEEVGFEFEEQAVAAESNTNDDHNQRDVHMSMMHRLNPTNPLRIVINSNTRAATPPPPRFSHGSNNIRVGATPSPSHFSHTPPHSQPRSTPTPQPSITTLNSRKYTNKISLFLFLLHMIAAIGLVGFLIFKGVQGLIEASDNRVKRAEKRVLKFFLPQVEAASLLSIILAFAWQKAVRVWPKFFVHFILWTTFLMSLSAGILLICFQKAATDGVGVCFIAFAIGNGLYACWITQRIGFCSKILIKSLEPVSKFPDLNQPTYWMLGVGFLWMSLWNLAVIGALNFYLTPLMIVLLGLSLAWTAEVMRNVANITVSRVISLYYLRGMQSNTKFCFQRALSKSLGSACFASLFVPSIEALRIVARALNLLEGEDEFMFSCAHCCLRVMESIFRYGNGWAFVQIAAYGKGFVKASQDTWELFERQEMEQIVDSDITSSICFLTGVCSGSMCVIVVAAWTATVHQSFTATISLLAFFIGYLMTRIAMALPHACVGSYFVCYAENPDNRLFDNTIKDRLALMKSGRDVAIRTPRVPRRFAAR
ncbi:CTL-like protein DDB_G0274487 [Prunus avium]|uniref:Choline transporter-like protein n=1 Tax=Prunus avium TaxID=42229 RepID=A0A6P5RJM1_PRUAV|nr:CTL-like protein DDB_G0274487 [Prunus avium]